jgi:hypothetical protein
MGEHWEEGCRVPREWNDHEHHGKGEVHGEWKKKLMFGDDGMEVRIHKECVSGVNGMMLCNNVRMTFIDELLHVMGTDDFRGVGGDALELVLLALLDELHG